VTPVGLLALTIGFGALLPEASFTTDYGAFLRSLGLPAEGIDASLAIFEGLPVSPVVFLVGQGLWRGLLLRELSPLGFWRLSVLTGVVWGIRYSPLIVQVYNFPDASVAGIGAALLATAVCVVHDRYVAAVRVTAG